MTIASSAAPGAAPTSGQRIWRVVRLNLVNKWTVIWLPIIIMFFIWLVNWLIWWIIWAATPPAGRATALEGTEWSGGAFYIFVYMCVVGIQVIAATFPFALGLSVTRRHFALGSALTFLILGAGYAIGFATLASIEEWTNGWGLGGHIFTSVYFQGQGYGGRLFIAFVGMLFFFFVGAFSASLFMRWRMYGIIAAGAALTLLVIGALALIALTDGWPAVGAWFDDNGVLGVTAWLLLPTLLAGLAGYAVLRRATPKS
ncbi:hypothetical protein IT072_06355 [Leifsonia sp. ZF2019]|uniref:hypothetical protein n=1 Tax=Leifsonia sp. ZF2019 TaxID=2781978 RepID=UPI001CBC95F0|nr:hypothetical protein [Leifsonia sp. ZF2019]UAJ80634.1 hypothetical protein IT072_06355 [Leifsonia sp. ZF2019]